MNEVQLRFEELSGKWDELQMKFSEKIVELEEKFEVVIVLNNEVEIVFR